MQIMQDALRAALVAVAACALAECWLPAVRDARTWRRRGAWTLAALVFLTPALVTGYGYSNTVLALVRRPALRLVVHSLLTLFRFAPVALLLRHAYRPAISSEAAHCARLLQTHGAAEPGWLTAHRFGPVWLGEFCLVFLFTFGEMELASLLYVETWTVRLFDSQLGGLALSECLRRILPPLIVSAVVLGLAITVLRHVRLSLDEIERNASPRRWQRLLAWPSLLFGVFAVLIAPLATILLDTMLEPGALRATTSLAGDIVRSTCVAAATALLAWQMGRVICGRSRPTMPSVACCLPALPGGLALALALLALFNLPGLRVLRDSPIPLALGLWLRLLPTAIVGALVLAANRPAAGLHIASLLAESADPRRRSAGRRVASALRGHGHQVLLAVLFVQAYFELTLSAILAPAGLSVVSVRLYNLMHYGRAATLSAMVGVSLLIPCALAAAGIAAFRHRRGK